jgi:hypothetical protein
MAIRKPVGSVNRWKPAGTAAARALPVADALFAAVRPAVPEAAVVDAADGGPVPADRPAVGLGEALAELAGGAPVFAPEEPERSPNSA